MGAVPAKKYHIKLSLQEREELQAIAGCKKSAAGKVSKAKALLLSDEGEYGGYFKDEDVSLRSGLTVRSIERLRKRCCAVGPLTSLVRQPQTSPSRVKKFGGYEQAQLVKLACSDAPEGCARWTLDLLAKKLVEMYVVGSVSRETIRWEL